jgi:ribosomal protein S18 acetylase RimI-like enzyme
LSVGPDGLLVGAAWFRLYGPAERGEGIVAWPDTPELSIGVRSEVRGEGIGRRLLTALIAVAGAHGYPRLVLSVDPGNPATRLYQRGGFREVPACDPARGTSLLMGLDLGAPEPR